MNIQADRFSLTSFNFKNVRFRFKHVPLNRGNFAIHFHFHSTFSEQENIQWSQASVF
jgi:hypothetical protein